MGSIAGNLLLVLGFTLLFGRNGAVDRPSAYISLSLVGFATLLVLVAAVPGFHGAPDRRTLAELSLPLAAVLLVVRVTVTRYALRRQRLLYASAEQEPEGWPHRNARRHAAILRGQGAPLGVRRRGLDRRDPRKRNGTRERGAAGARRGRVKPAVEIPSASSAQIAGLLIPLIALISWGFEPLAFSFRPVELVAMGAAAALPAVVLTPGRTTRRGGAILLGAYAALAVAFFLSGDR